MYSSGGTGSRNRSIRNMAPSDDFRWDESSALKKQLLSRIPVVYSPTVCCLDQFLFICQTGHLKKRSPMLFLCRFVSALEEDTEVNGNVGIVGQTRPRRRVIRLTLPGHVTSDRHAIPTSLLFPYLLVRTSTAWLGIQPRLLLNG